jgi:ATP-dependent DNA helicase DinG
MKLDERTVTKEELISATNNWAGEIYGVDFKFRPHQLDTIVSIIWNWLKGVDDVILDAPTGSGKSFIAITVAGVLSECFNKRGYILISDLSLLKQYEDDLSVYLPSWGVIRGQQTYNCLVNGLNFKAGVCHLQGITGYSEISTHFSECAPYCEYIVSREKAIKSKVTVCTYTHWLLQQNYVKPKFKSRGMDSPFDDRDFIICDEAHKLVNIIQNHFSPRISKHDENKLFNVIIASDSCEKQELKNQIVSVRNKILYETDKNNLLALLEDYLVLLEKINKLAERVKINFGKISETRKLRKDERTTIYDCEFVMDHYCKFDDYIPVIKNIGVDYMVKNDGDSGSISFNNLNESYLMHKAFHHNCKKKLYMSATIGDPSSFSKEAAFAKYEYIKLPSVFDYTNSPIFYVTEYKMSYNEKEKSFPMILKMIEKILTMYPDKRGIIQTGSYSFAKNLYDNIDSSLRSRILLYEDSGAKQDNLDIYKCLDNKVLVGPSLIEGLSLDDDLCRFQIIMKVPYPSLSDKFISAKRNFNPIWYSNTTSISILQGIGRGVRNEKDWCVTFILDACFSNLLNTSSGMFSKEFIDRIQIIPSQILLV